jgi:phosphoribosylformylglycinamidine cyclo-ligase
LDYLACGKLDSNIAAEIVKGVAVGCREAGCVLLGGETAEMPGFYDTGKYDIAGFAVGIADRAKIVDGSKIRKGDALLGIASSGPHSNGFSLIRKVLPDMNEDFGGMPIGMALLEPTRIYVKPILGLMEHIDIHGMAHITGGGFIENIPRMFKKNETSAAEFPEFDAVIYEKSWTIPPIFSRIAKGCAFMDDETENRQMFNTFNMGIGFILSIAKCDVQYAIEYLDNAGFPSWEIGCIENAVPADQLKNDTAGRIAGGNIRFVKN